jgi:hypothetical protein
MKKIFHFNSGRGFFLSTAFLVGFCPLILSNDISVPPSDEDIVHSVIENHDVKLRTHESCRSAWVDLKGDTIGDYFSAIVAASSTKDFEGVELRISAHEATWGPSDIPSWRCSVEYQLTDPESPWSRGVTFYMKTSDHSVLRNSFSCPGTP